MTAAEVSHLTWLAGARLDAAVSYQRTDYPIDSILTAMSTNAAKWLAQLTSSPITGVQRDPAGRVGVAAGNETAAEAQFAARLATPGLSLADRAHTYMTAVHAFTNWRYPDRLPKAEAYLAKLDAMGDSAAMWQYDARSSLVYAYYMLGRSTEVAKHGMRALTLATILPFKARERTVFPQGGTSMYTMTIEALTGRPDGPAQISRLNAILQEATATPPELAVLDSGFVALGKHDEGILRHMRMTSALLGTSGTPLIGSLWLNRPNRDSATMRVDDGKIRLITFATYGCPGCNKTLYDLQRVKAQFPKLETVWMTYTVGAWANRQVPPAEEAAHLTERFLTRMKIDFPIGIEYVPMVPNEDGGMSARDRGQNVAHYSVTGLTLTIALDGRGIVRRIFIQHGREGEVQLIRTVQFLEREAASQAAISSPAQTLPVQTAPATLSVQNTVGSSVETVSH
jgi:hypothetical protein